MAKLTESIFSTISEICTQAEQLGVAYQTSEDQQYHGKNLLINGQNVLNFSSCSYLGLETDQRLKQGVMKSVMRYGSQFSMTRAFLSAAPYTEIEELLEKLFDAYVLVTSSTSMGHQSVMPVVVKDNDVVILDQRVHASVQLAANMLKLRGIKVEMIRHSKMDELEDAIKSNLDKGRKIYYCIDGVYSMFGDYAPYTEIMDLMRKYDSLNLYIDDAHGMSWAGINGRGFTLSQIELTDRIILGTSLNKSFASSGGVFLFKDRELREKVKYCGALHTFSGPIQPPMLGAIIESAKIHLSPEIYDLQNSLKDKINHTNKCIDETGLPLVQHNEAPIFFIGTGSPKVCFNLSKRLLNEGYFVSVGAFPAVPVKNTGIRFAINNHLSKNDISGLVKAIDYHFPQVLEEEGKSTAEVYSLFNLDYAKSKKSTERRDEVRKTLNVQVFDSITQIDREEWDDKMGSDIVLDWNDIRFLETVFKNNPDKYNNWSFYYITIRDNEGAPLLMSFLTAGYTKEDMLSPVSISMQVEKHRKKDPAFLINKTLMLGTVITEGKHIFVDRKSPVWKEVAEIFLEEVAEIQEKEAANSVILRDFNPENDKDLTDVFFNEGFIKVQLPDSYNLYNLEWDNFDEFLSSLTKRNRRHLRDEILSYSHKVNVEIAETVGEDEIKTFYRLYQNVQKKALEINSIVLPIDLFHKFNEDPAWEFIIIRSKPEHGFLQKEEIIAVVLSKKADFAYIPVMVGIDYRYLYTHGNYRQSLYHIVLRAKELGYSEIRLEMGAGIEKRKFGSSKVENLAFVQIKDTYAQDYMYTLSQEKLKVKS